MRVRELGTWAEIPSPYTTDIMCRAGLDFTIIDMEHGIIDFETAQNMIFAAHSRNKKSYIRVPAIEESWILRSLDTGCDGIIFPQVACEDDVERIIKYSMFPPKGERGFNPYITAGGYSPVNNTFFVDENERLSLGIIIEGLSAFENIDGILKYPEIDIVYIGQYDLSMALGVPGKVSDSKVLEYMKRAVTKIRESGKRPGCMVHTIEEAKDVINQGFEFIVYKVDTGILFQTIHQFVEGVK